jgi:hypothetical protein
MNDGIARTEKRNQVRNAGNGVRHAIIRASQNKKGRLFEPAFVIPVFASVSADARCVRFAPTDEPTK